MSNSSNNLRGSVPEGRITTRIKRQSTHALNKSSHQPVLLETVLPALVLIRVVARQVHLQITTQEMAHSKKKAKKTQKEYHFRADRQTIHPRMYRRITRPVFLAWIHRDKATRKYLFRHSKSLMVGWSVIMSKWTPFTRPCAI
jgi:hypothetical protein